MAGSIKWPQPVLRYNGIFLEALQNPTEASQSVSGVVVEI
jgi:hypothetical protein